MTSLLDNILSPQTPQEIAPQQKQIESLIRAKSGKATGPTGPSLSNLGERQVLAQGKIAQQQQAAQSILQKEALKQQEVSQLQQQDIATEQLQQQVKTSSQIIDDQINSLMQKAQQGTQELELRKDAAELEQLGFLLSLQDKTYLTQLDQIGKQRRLESQGEFDQQLQDMVFGEQLQEYLTGLGFQANLNKSDRQLQKELTTLKGDQIMDLSRLLIQASNQQAMWEGAGQLSGGAGQAYGKYEKKQSQEK